MNIYIYWILDLDNEVHSIWVIWTINLQESKSHAKVGVSQGRDFPVLPLPTCPNACNARHGFLERPVVANAPPLLKSWKWFRPWPPSPPNATGGRARTAAILWRWGVRESPPSRPSPRWRWGDLVEIPSYFQTCPLTSIGMPCTHSWIMYIIVMYCVGLMTWDVSLTTI